jgi:adenosine deaminase
VSTNDNRRERLQGLPKAELHVHIEGTLEPELAYEMASRNGAGLPLGGAEELAGKYKFDNLQDFLDLYYLAMSGLQNEADFLELGRAYGARAANEGVRHAEVFFDPQAHLVRGVEFGSVLGGLSSALDEMRTQYGISGGLILCFLRDRPVREALETLDLALSEHPEPIIGVGLDSAEVGYPPRAFCEVFREARSAGLRLCAHAGEEGPPSYIWEALDELGVDRVDHGIRAVEDPVLVERLANDGTPLTVCPLSNVRLRACGSMEAHPILALLEKGVHVTINSDDPAYFGGYITANYAAVSDLLGMTEVQAGQIARNSVDASFAPAERKELLLAEVEAWERAIAPE